MFTQGISVLEHMQSPKTHPVCFSPGCTPLLCFGDFMACASLDLTPHKTTAAQGTPQGRGTLTRGRRLPPCEAEVRGPAAGAARFGNGTELPFSLVSKPPATSPRPALRRLWQASEHGNPPQTLLRPPLKPPLKTTTREPQPFGRVPPPPPPPPREGGGRRRAGRQGRKAGRRQAARRPQRLLLSVWQGWVGRRGAHGAEGGGQRGLSPPPGTEERQRRGPLSRRWGGGRGLPLPPPQARSRTHGSPGDPRRRAPGMRRAPPAGRAGPGRAAPRPEARCRGRSSASNRRGRSPHGRGGFLPALRRGEGRGGRSASPTRVLRPSGEGAVAAPRGAGRGPAAMLRRGAAAPAHARRAGLRLAEAEALPSFSSEAPGRFLPPSLSLPPSLRRAWLIRPGG